MKFLKNQDGATVFEYGLIAALLAIAAIMIFDRGPAKQTTDEPLSLTTEAPAKENPADINPPG
jgi:Flp/Fap pilin component